MSELVFEKCCDCIDLKTGCFIIGYLNFVLTLILTILSALAVLVRAMIASKNDPDTHNTGTTMIIMSGIFLVFLLIDLAYGIVLLLGLHKKKPGYLKAYLVYSLIQLVVFVIEFVVVCSTPNVTAGTVVLKLINILLSVYFMLVIRSMYFEMKVLSRDPAIFLAA